MNILHYAPSACSLSVHIVLEEIGEPFERKRLVLSRGEHELPAFIALNPLQRVPVLETSEGTLTEASAILQWLARGHSHLRLLPEGPRLARAQEWLNFLSSMVHPTFALVFRPERYVLGAEAQAILIERSRARAEQLLANAAARFGSGPWACGDDFGVVDAYLFVFLRWARRVELDGASWQALVPFFDRMLARPSVRRAMLAEGLIEDSAA